MIAVDIVALYVSSSQATYFQDLNSVDIMVSIIVDLQELRSLAVQNGAPKSLLITEVNSTHTEDMTQI